MHPRSTPTRLPRWDPAGCVAPRSNTPGILGRRALPSGRLARLGATPDFHHGLLSREALIRFGLEPIDVVEFFERVERPLAPGASSAPRRGCRATSAFQSRRLHATFDVRVEEAQPISSRLFIRSRRK